MRELPWKENWEPSYRITIGVKPVTDIYTHQETVTVPKSLQDPKLVEGTEVKPAYSKYMSNIVEDGFDRKGFSFSFDTTNALSQNGSDTENSTLELWNVDEEVADMLTSGRAVVSIEAGYQQKVMQFYYGDVVKVRTRKENEGIVHIIKCATAAFAAKNTMVNLNYSEELSEKDVLIDMAGRFAGNSVITTGLNDLNGTYRTGGRTFIGSLVTNLDKQVSKNSVYYAHIRGSLILVPYRLKGEDYNNFVKTNYTLSPESIIDIEDTTDKAGVSDEDEKSKMREVTLNTFFLPVDVGQAVTIPDADFASRFKGTYLVKATRFILSTVTNTWVTVLKLEAV